MSGFGTLHILNLLVLQTLKGHAWKTFRRKEVSLPLLIPSITLPSPITAYSLCHSPVLCHFPCLPSLLPFSVTTYTSRYSLISYHYLYLSSLSCFVSPSHHCLVYCRSTSVICLRLPFCSLTITSRAKVQSESRPLQRITNVVATNRYLLSSRRTKIKYVEPNGEKSRIRWYLLPSAPFPRLCGGWT